MTDRMFMQKAWMIGFEVIPYTTLALPPTQTTDRISSSTFDPDAPSAVGTC